MSPPVFTLRRCFCLCLPALIVGALLRVCFLCAIPEGFNGSDTASYSEAMDRLWRPQHPGLRFSPKRRWLYPILLMPLPALPVSPAHSIPVLQHLLGLAALFGIGWIVGNLTLLRGLWVPLVTMACAVWPKMLWFEHEVGGDILFMAAFVLTAALAFPAGSLRDRKRLFLFLIAAAIVASIKPHGRGIWFGSLCAAALVAGNPWRWDRKCWGAIAAGVLLILTSGDKIQGNWLLLDSVLPLVNLDGTSWKEYRQALKPTILEARKDLGQYPWRQGEFKKALRDGDPTKIDPVWAALAHREEEFCKVTGALDREALLRHPLREMQFTLTKIGISFVQNDLQCNRMSPAAFWAKERHELEERWQSADQPLQTYFQMDQPHFEAMVRERELRHNPIVSFELLVSRRIDWMREHLDRTTGRRSLSLGWLGAFALFGLLVALTPARFVNTAVIWLPALLCLITVHAVGDRNTQYVLPVEWAGLVLSAIGLDAICVFCGSFFKRSKTGAESAAYP